MKYFLNILDLFYLLKAKIIAQITQKSRMKKDRDLLSSLKNKNGGV